MTFALQDRVVVQRDNINTLEFRFGINGELRPLNPITRIDLWIPGCDLRLEDTQAFEYPLKWQLTPERIGIMEMRLGSWLFTNDVTTGTWESKIYIYDNGEFVNGMRWAELGLVIKL
jgi:hypothetical protein